MWPFRSREPVPDYKDLVALVEQHREQTERRMKDIRLEWEDMYDRFRRLYAKISKRAKDAESVAIEDPEGTEGRAPGDRPGNGQPAPIPSVLGRRIPMGRHG
jgi:hypothetical protein